MILAPPLGSGGIWVGMGADMTINYVRQARMFSGLARLAWFRFRVSIESRFMGLSSLSGTMVMDV